ncbi:DNA polymerase III subunit delta [Leuconostoc citreum]|uniref:DNA polymerase III subunit delta n=1 Tax=Leuconostoc citreum TaxID=33964 RepID=UPI001C1FC66B|nr:DNA polymerase III subunit delta [Leuconostoc citreum]MBU7450910.1 DNA polymerase III subunit delta [Leuconostoc citreum]
MQPDFLTTTKQYYPTQMGHFHGLIRSNRLSHLYLFVGPSQQTKLAFSHWLAWEVVGPNELNAMRINKNEHPDVKITRPSLPKSGSGTKRTWKVDQIRSLKPEFITMSRESPRKVFVFDAIETLQAEAGNALLKYIEEPAGPQLMVMLAENVNDILPTIKSRAQIVHLRPEIQLDTPHNDETIADFEAWQQLTRSLLFKWFELMMQRRIEAFVYVQQYLVSQLKDEQQQALFLNWLHELTRDTIVFGQIPETQLKFPKLIGLYKVLNKQYNQAQLVKASDAILRDDFFRQFNMTLQARLEKIVLDVAIALGA